MADSRLMKTRDGHPGKHGTSKGALALSTPRFTLLPDTIFVHVAATSPWLGRPRSYRNDVDMFATMFATSFATFETFPRNPIIARMIN